MSDFTGVSRRGLLLQTVGGLSAPRLEDFVLLFAEEPAQWKSAMVTLRSGWRPGHAAMVLEMLRVFTQVSREETAIQSRVMRFLSERTGKNFELFDRQWNQWIWSLPYDPHPRYGEFKGLVYSRLDARMLEFFPPGVVSKIRLDQIEWGGVVVNGIPPLVNPAMIRAREAGYLRDSHVVFGVESDGEAKAYPKRILAWHEMAIDRVGKLDLTIVYCTLCGTVIPYRNSVGGRRFRFGTSGLLYESSKLMFDEETKSLWPTLQGQPMVGPLAGTGLQLEFAPVVTTTWGEWRARYPETLVLSLETGYRRDYSEGAAYRNYFGTQDLMFEVSRRDGRLKNKDEVLIVRLEGKKPLAIAVRTLERKAEFELRHEGVALVVRDANRVYVGEKRVPAFRAFWFGWITQFPETVLVR